MARVRRVRRRVFYAVRNRHRYRLHRVGLDKVHALKLTETREGLRVELTFSYSDKLPRAPARKAALAAFLDEAADRIRNGEVVAIGEANDTSKLKRTMVRRDDYLVEREAP